MRLSNSELQLTWASLRSAHAAELCYVSRKTFVLWPVGTEQLGPSPCPTSLRSKLHQYGLCPILMGAVATVVQGDFEWDEVKAEANLVKHGVSFAEAATVFADPHAIYLDDGSNAERMVIIGASIRDRLLYVVHVERGSRDRIISARSATNGERDVYET